MTNLPTKKDPIETGRAVVALVPQNVESAFRVAGALSRAGEMIPKDFRDQPDKIMAAIMRGAEVGLAPMQALSHISVINGRATLWGDAIPALILKAGHHIDVEIEGEGDSAVAVATLTRGDTGKTVVRRFSMADAKRAGLAGKPGPWQQYPQRMLMHRARSWAVRDGAADALMGMQISEEVQDYGPDTARDVTPKRRGSTTFTPVDAPEPELDEILDGDAEYAPTEDEIAQAEAAAMAEIKARDAAIEGGNDAY
jgi:hypothetical protein